MADSARRALVLSAGLSFVFVACGVRLDVPDDTVMSCTTDDDCPETYQCKQSTKVCVQPGTTEPPSVAVARVQRSVGTVDLRVTARDGDSTSVTLGIRFRNGGSFERLTALDGTTVGASPEGVETVLTWSPASDLVDLVTNPTGLGYVDALEVEITPTDGISDGPAVTTSFSFGNDPPRLVYVMTDGGVISSLRDLVVLRFAVEDSASDLIALDSVHARAVDDQGATLVDVDIPITAGRLGRFPSGGLTGLITEPEVGVEHSVVWNSLLDAIVTSDHLVLTVTVRDVWDGVSEPLSTEELHIQNQTPPRVDGIYVKSDGDIRSGAIPIVYRLSDEQRDTSDVLVEFSSDGTLWARCTEYVVPESEGFYDLTTAPQAEGGVPHVFVWDAGSDLASRSVSLRVRITASDGVAGAPAEVLPASVVGPPGDLGAALAAGNAYETGADYGQIYAIRAADFDGDGRDEVVVLNANTWPIPATYDLRFFRSNSATPGALLAPTTIAIPWANDIEVTDASGDGIPDILVAASASAEPKLQILRGGGSGSWNGTFAGIQALTGTPSVALLRMHAQYVDGDGLPDLVIVTGDGYMGAMRNLGAGAFDAPSTHSVPYAKDARAADFDGDGIMDLVGCVDNEYADTSGLYFARGTGAFAFATPVRIPGPRCLPPLEVGDFDGDTDLDVAVGCWDPQPTGLSFGPVLLYVSTPDGSGGVEWNLETIRPDDHRAHRIVATDANRDGAMDIATLDAGGTMSLLMSPAGGDPGVVHVPSALTVRTGGLYPLLAWPAELNGDGATDVILADYASLSLVVSQRPMGVGSAGFSSAVFFPLGGRARDVGMVDTDLDGGLDFWSLPQIAYSTIDRFASETVVAVAAPGWRTAEHVSLSEAVDFFVPVDFDRDGRPDLIGVDDFGRVRWSRGIDDARYSGALDAQVVASIATDPVTVAVADFNRDGALDVLTGHGNSYGFAACRLVLTNVAGGLDDGGMAPSPAGPARALVPGFFDADDDMDFAVAGGSSILVYFGNGNATFVSSPTTLTPSAPPVSLVSADFNADGIVDLAAGIDRTSGPDGVAIYLGHADSPGHADGTFTAAGELDAGDGPIALAAGDWNGDGATDLACANYESLSVSVFVAEVEDGVGTGAFLDGEVFETGAGPDAILPGDLNGDGVLDLTVSNSLSGDVALLTGRRIGVSDVWRLPLRVWSDSPGHGSVLGASTLPTGVDRFGRSRIAQLGVRRWRGPGDAADASAAAGLAVNDFRDALRWDWRAPPSLGLVPITNAWVITGDVRLTRNAPTDIAGARLVVEPRFGARVNGWRQGLALVDDGSEQRGVVVDLPRFPGRSTGTVMVQFRAVDWLRSSDAVGGEGGDPGTNEDPTLVLPRVERADAPGTYRDVIAPRYAWVDVAEDDNGDLSDGEGPRFVVLGDRIRVLLDRGGVIQAFASQ